MPPYDKKALRRAVRSSFPGRETRDAESRAICDHVRGWEPFQAARVVAGYLPMPMEADVTPLLLAALREGKTLALPRCEDTGVMTFRSVRSLDELVPGRWSCPEPPADAPLVPPETIDLVLVPLEAIDPAGHRLGKGGGYYDRWLPQMQAATLGVALRHQRVDRVPCDPHDVPLPFACDADGIHPLF